eukprot:tig00001027_g6383.t1
MALRPVQEEGARDAAFRSELVDCVFFKHDTLLRDERSRHVVEQLVLRIFFFSAARSRPVVCCRFEHYFFFSTRRSRPVVCCRSEHYFFFSTRRSRPVVEQLLMRIFFSASRRIWPRFDLTIPSTPSNFFQHIKPCVHSRAKQRTVALSCASEPCSSDCCQCS